MRRAGVVDLGRPGRWLRLTSGVRARQVRASGKASGKGKWPRNGVLAGATKRVREGAVLLRAGTHNLPGRKQFP